jgi:3,4-dihydroxy 2-butanone 4-phosphate synthase/GTP cyclohydrolase II
VQTAQIARDVFGIGAEGPGAAVWLKMIEDEGRGVFLYVLSPSHLDLRLDSSRPAALASGQAGSPLRDFGLGAQVLAHLGVGQIRLLTNKPRRIAGVEGYGIQVVECVPSRPPAVVVPLREENG